MKYVSTKSYEISPVWTLAVIITKLFCVVVQEMWYLIGYGTYDNEDIKLGILLKYSATLELKTVVMVTSCFYTFVVVYNILVKYLV